MTTGNENTARNTAGSASFPCELRAFPGIVARIQVQTLALTCSDVARNARVLHRAQLSPSHRVGSKNGVRLADLPQRLSINSEEKTAESPRGLSHFSTKRHECRSEHAGEV
jgi:hypothetical protein